MHMAAMLVICFAAVDLPPEATGARSLALARQLLPDARLHRTKRYQILSLTDRTLVRAAESTLEETRRQYDRWCRTVGAPRARPEERLLCIVLPTRETFADFARQTEDLGGAADLVSGYFSPRFDWIVWFDPAAGQAMGDAFQSLDDAEARIDAADAAGAPNEQVDAARSTLDDARAELAREEAARRTEIAVHEAVHQLVHVGTAFPGRDGWPDWLHEGIAVAFETDRPRKPFGPDRDHARRADGFRAALAAGTAIALEDMLRLDRIDHTAGAHVGVLYDQAGSLVSWLHRRKRRALGEFLSTLGVPGPDGATASVESAFVAAFGPVADIERRWHADVAE
jgi:hypothetical protein